MLNNLPSPGETPIRLAARKPFVFGIRVLNANKDLVDITGCTFRLVVKPKLVETVTDDSDALINITSTLPDPENGMALISLQAAELDLAAKEYPYVITLTTDAGYTAVAAMGMLEVVANAEAASIGTTFSDVNPATVIDVMIERMNTLQVIVGTLQPPNAYMMTPGEKDSLAQLITQFLELGSLGTAAYEDATAFVPAGEGVPAGGFVGRVLGKLSNDDHDIGWLNVGTGGGGLDATGIPINYVPLSDGAGGWEWAVFSPPVTIATADDLDDGLTKVVMTVAEREKLDGIAAGAQVNVKSDWAATGTPAEILNKPSLDFSPSSHTHELLDLSNVTMGTDAPTGGSPGDFYLRKKS